MTGFELRTSGEATAPPTEPQPLPKSFIFSCKTVSREQLLIGEKVYGELHLN